MDDSHTWMINRGAVRLLLLSMLLTSLLALGGCGRAAGPEPTPTPTKTPIPAAGGEAAGDVAVQATPAPPVVETGAQPPSVAEPAVAEPATRTETIGVITAAELNVRSAPSSDGAIVGSVLEGEEYGIGGRSEDGQWVELDDDGRLLGWAAAEFVELRTIEVPADGAAAQATAPAQQPSTEQPAGQQPAPVGSGNYLPATMSSPDFGTQAFMWWREEIADRDLNLISDANFNWVKQTFAWETIEAPVRGQYDWSISDRVVQHTNNANLKLLARLSSDPELQDKFWAGKPPGNADAFAEYAYEIANRYNCTPEAVGCIQAYQVWNEPNLAREWGGNPPNPAEYAAFLGKTYAAIKRGNPNAIVVSAGMAPTGDNNANAMPDDLFYEGMYQAMGGNSDGYFDMLGVHGAGFAAPPELDPAVAASDPKYGGYRFFAFRHVEDIRAIMERYGDSDKKIVLLEFGWTYDRINPSYKWHGADAGIDEFVQADYLKRAYQYAEANWQPWIGLMSLITMPNIDWLEDGNPQDEEQYWWAIMDPGYPDTFWRPAYIELCIYFNSLEGAKCKYDPN